MQWQKVKSIYIEDNKNGLYLRTESGEIYFLKIPIDYKGNIKDWPPPNIPSELRL